MSESGPENSPQPEQVSEAAKQRRQRIEELRSQTSQGAYPPELSALLTEELNEQANYSKKVEMWKPIEIELLVDLDDFIKPHYFQSGKKAGEVRKRSRPEFKKGGKLIMSMDPAGEISVGITTGQKELTITTRANEINDPSKYPSAEMAKILTSHPYINPNEFIEGVHFKFV